jgi:hypothetical protein
VPARREDGKKRTWIALQAPQDFRKVYLRRHTITNDKPDHPGSSNGPKVLQTNTTNIFKGQTSNPVKEHNIGHPEFQEILSDTSTPKEGKDQSMWKPRNFCSGIIQ